MQQKIITIDREKPDIQITQINQGYENGDKLFSGWVEVLIEVKNEDLVYCKDNFSRPLLS